MFHLSDDYPDFDEFGVPICAQTDPEVFFPENPAASRDAMRVGNGNSVRIAKQLCGTCPYVQRCLAYALDNPDLIGVWGGTSYSDRMAMRRRLKGLPPIKKYGYK